MDVISFWFLTCLIYVGRGLDSSCLERLGLCVTLHICSPIVFSYQRPPPLSLSLCTHTHRDTSTCRIHPYNCKPICIWVYWIKKYSNSVFVIKNLPCFPLNLQWKVQNYKDKQRLPASVIMCSCDKEHGCVMSLCVGSQGGLLLAQGYLFGDN